MRLLVGAVPEGRGRSRGGGGGMRGASSRTRNAFYDKVFIEEIVWVLCGNFTYFCRMGIGLKMLCFVLRTATPNTRFTYFCKMCVLDLPTTPSSLAMSPLDH